MSDAKIRFAWESSVGNSMARATSVQFDTSGTLHIKTDTEEWRREISRSIPIINKRLGQVLGSSVVRRIIVKRQKR